MKKLSIMIALLVLGSLQVFAEGVPAENPGEKYDLNIPFLNENFLLRVPYIFSSIGYETPGGKKVSYKDVNLRLEEIEENQDIMKAYKIWRGTSIGFASLAVAGLATATVFGCIEKTPYTDDIMIAGYGTLLSGLVLSSFTGKVAELKYNRAVDNYNLSLFKKQRL